jgi:hypothetical protein
MKRQLFVLALALVGCGQTPTPKPEPAKTAPAASVPAASVPISAPATQSKPEDEPQRDMLSVVTANGVEEAQGMGDPEKAKQPSSKVFKNAKLLGDISSGRFMASMQSMSASVGGDCSFCHKSNDFSSDANGHKVISRKMIEMSFAINRDHFENKVSVSCYTCHQGNKKPKASPAPEKAGKELAEADKKKPAGTYFKNIKYLTDLPAGELGPLMRRINDALGVSCEFCHVKGAFESDEKPAKTTARAMLQMTAAINKTYFAKKKTPVITCGTCHNGAKKPPISVGPKLMVSTTVKEQTDWSAIIGVAKWPTPPKTRAELESLFFKPAPNEALVVMLSPSDTGEMGHLPPGEYQLCGVALPAKGSDDKLKEARPVTCQTTTIAATPNTQTVKIELAAP